MALLIRPATVADSPLVFGFVRALAEYERLLDELEATEPKLRALLFPSTGQPAAECLLAFAGGQPAGFAIFYPNFSIFLAKPGLYLEDLYVAPDFRGRGIGRALLRHLAALAKARGCGRLEWTVLDWNKRAIAFYESIGARHLREWQVCRLSGAALTRFAASTRPSA